MNLKKKIKIKLRMIAIKFEIIYHLFSLFFVKKFWETTFFRIFEISINFFWRIFVLHHDDLHIMASIYLFSSSITNIYSNFIVQILKRVLNYSKFFDRLTKTNFKQFLRKYFKIINLKHANNRNYWNNNI